MKKQRWVLCTLLGIMMAALLVLAILLPLILFSMSLGDLAEKKVVQTLESPNGTYIAQVISSDQGAMGGNTLVEVYPKGKPRQKQRVYMGEWGEHDYMEIHWKSDTCLVINGAEYPIQ